MPKCEDCDIEMPEGGPRLCPACQAARLERDSQATVDEPPPTADAGAGGETITQWTASGDGSWSLADSTIDEPPPEGVAPGLGDDGATVDLDDSETGVFAGDSHSDAGSEQDTPISLNLADENAGPGATATDDGSATPVFDESAGMTTPRSGAPTLHGGPPGVPTIDLTPGDSDPGGGTDHGDDRLTRQDEGTLPPDNTDHIGTIDVGGPEPGGSSVAPTPTGGSSGGDSSGSATFQVGVPHLAGESLLSVSSRPIAYPEAEPDGKADYRVEKFVAKGGMGRVYLAQQTSLGRTVALKTLAEDLAEKDRYRKKFFAEASITGLLDHPNIVPIHDLGVRGDGVPFYSMKFVTGEPWSDSILQKGKTENVNILLSVADAMAFAHSKKILHRDLKPENVMLGEYGEVLVVDWGLAIHLERDKEFSLGGTPLYMAPEMANHDVPLIGVRSDVYLLGAMLFEVLEGQAPHASGGKTATERLLVAAMNKIQPHQSADELIDVALKAMQTNPSDRYADVKEFQAAVLECQRHSDSRERAERAAAELRLAEESGDNERFSRALFAYQDAIDLWPDNGAAREGLQAARLAYAGHALEQQDHAFGLSLLDAGDPEHQPLREKLLAAQAKEQQRERRLRIARNSAIGATAATVLSLVAFAFFANDAATKQAKLTEEAQASEREAVRQAGIARDNAERAEENAEREKKAKQEEAKQRGIAEEAKEEAIRQKDLATALAKAEAEANTRAQAARRAAEASEENARRRAFVAELALTAADLAVADTDTASERLASVEADYPELLDWEADRLRFLCHRDFARVAIGGRVARVAASAGGGGLALVVERGGATSLVFAGADPGGSGVDVSPAVDLQLASIECVTLGPDRLLAAAGKLPSGERAIEVRRRDQPARRRLIPSPNDAWRFTGLAFSPDGAELAVAHHASLEVRVQAIDLASDALRLDPRIDTADEFRMAGVGAFQRLAYSGDGRWLAAVERSGVGRATVSVWSREAASGPFTSRARLPVDARCVAFRPKRAGLLACGEAGGALSMFDLTGPAPSEAARFEPHTDDVTDLAFARDGNKLVTASASGVALVWSAEADSGTGDVVWRIDDRPPIRHLSALRGCTFADEDNAVLTVGAAGLLRAWPLGQFFDTRRVSTARNAAALAASTADGRLVVGDAGGHTRLVNPERPAAPVADLFVGHPGDAIAAAWPLGAGVQATLAFDGGRATLCRWGTGGEFEGRVAIDGVNEADRYDLSPDGDALAVASLQGLRVVGTDGSRGGARSTLLASSVAYLPSGRLVVGDARGRLSLMAAREGRLERSASETIAPRRELRWLAAPRDSRLTTDTLYAATDGAGPQVFRITIDNRGEFTAETLAPLPAAIQRFFARGTGVVAVCGERRNAYAWDAAAERWNKVGDEPPVAALPSGARSRAAVLLASSGNPDKERVTTVAADGFCRVWDPVSPSSPVDSVRIVAEGGEVLRAAESTNGPSIVALAVGSDAKVSLLVRRVSGVDWERIAPRGNEELSRSTTLAVGALAAGRRADQAAPIVAWDAEQGLLWACRPGDVRETEVLWRSEDALTSGPQPVALGAGGQVAAIASTVEGRQQVLHWTGRRAEPRRLPLEATRVTALAFSPSGRRLLAGTADGRIIVYDISAHRATGLGDDDGLEYRFDELTTFAEHRRPVTMLRFSSDGRTLISGDRQGQVVLWPTAPAADNQASRERAPRR